MNQTRFYSFVAGLYLDPLQKGLQTAHALGEMRNEFGMCNEGVPADSLFDQWCSIDKTIIILTAVNHAGVVGLYEKLVPLAKQLNLPHSIFFEDEASMNLMATACSVVVPEELYDVELETYDDVRDLAPVKMQLYVHNLKDEDGKETGVQTRYNEGTHYFEFIKLLKSYKRA